MNMVLDTHIALWAITDSPRLPSKARELIESPRSSVWISAASIWEIACCWPRPWSSPCA